MPAYDAYDQNYNARRDQSFFPNVQQRINSMPRLTGNQLNTFTLPSGGTVRVKAGSRLPTGYAQAQNQPVGTLTGPKYSDVPSQQPSQQLTPAEAGLNYQIGQSQGYYGTNPADFPAARTVNQKTINGTTTSLGGNYSLQGGVLNPNVPQQPGFIRGGIRNLATGFGLGYNAIASLFGGGASGAGQYGSGANQTQNYTSQPLYNPFSNRTDLSLYSPRRYFD